MVCRDIQISALISCYCLSTLILHLNFFNLTLKPFAYFYQLVLNYWPILIILWSVLYVEKLIVWKVWPTTLQNIMFLMLFLSASCIKTVDPNYFSALLWYMRLKTPSAVAWLLYSCYLLELCRHERLISTTWKQNPCSSLFKSMNELCFWLVLWWSSSLMKVYPFLWHWYHKIR